MDDHNALVDASIGQAFKIPRITAELQVLNDLGFDLSRALPGHYTHGRALSVLLKEGLNGVKDVLSLVTVKIEGWNLRTHMRLNGRS